MYYLCDINRLATFRVGLGNIAVGLRKVESVPGLKHIKVNSYFREGRIVRSSMRGLKPGKKIKPGSIKLIKNKPDIDSQVIQPKRIKPPKAFNYLNSEYNSRFNYSAKEELSTWSKLIDNMKPTKQQIEDWDDAKSIISYIEEEVRKSPTKFRSVSVNGKVGAMATITKDIKNKALYVENLVANPNKLNSSSEYGGAGTTLLLNLIEESYKLGYEGKITLSSLPGAVKFYRKLGFTPVGHPMNFKFELSPQAAQKLINDNLSLFSTNNTVEFSATNLVLQAMELEEHIIAFAIQQK